MFLGIPDTGLIVACRTVVALSVVLVKILTAKMYAGHFKFLVVFE